MSRTIVDFHIIQTVPPSNLNRDDTGSPKTATYGGVRRARVSSQAWKRATRTDFREHLEESDLGVRTKRLVELIGERIRTIEPSIEPGAAHTAAQGVLKAAGITVKEPRGRASEPAESGYLVFLADHQIRALSELAVRVTSSGDSVDEVDKKEAKALIKDKNSIDLALFGRMVADVTDLNVDASCQVAHALSTHAVETEYDYFTAVDDHKADDEEEDAGAGMIGTVEFNSATLYRYATIDVDRLRDNLGDDAATERAVATFARSFVGSMPTGKQNTFANRTLPDVLVISTRDDQSISYVGAFEDPVRGGSGGGRVRESAERLATYGDEVLGAFAAPPLRTWVVGVGAAGEAAASLGNRVTFDEAVSGLIADVTSRLATSA